MNSKPKYRRYLQKYRKSWECLSEFRGWLQPHPKIDTRAYCKICDIAVKAHLCDLRKHESTNKHRRAKRIVETLKILEVNPEDDEAEKVNVEENSYNDTDEQGDGTRLIKLLPTAKESTMVEESGRFRWTIDATKDLVKYIQANWKEFKQDLKKKKSIWKYIATQMCDDGWRVSTDECYRKFRNIKIRYLSILERKVEGKPFVFKNDLLRILHEFLEDDPETMAYLEHRKNAGPFNYEESSLKYDGKDIICDGDFQWLDGPTSLLLDLLIEFNEADIDTSTSDVSLWELMSEQMKVDGYDVEELQCHRKWHALVESYAQHKVNAEITGTVSLWPYYTRVRHIISTVNFPEERESLHIMKSVDIKRKKRKRHTSESNPNDVDEESCHQGSQKITEMRAQRLHENASVWRRLNSLEARLDNMGDLEAVQRQTNLILTQILTELSDLATHLNPA